MKNRLKGLKCFWVAAFLCSTFNLQPSTCSATPAQNIRTDRWGYAWTNDAGFADFVATTNTPGNAAFVGGRLTAPAQYAFLDGFDTRDCATRLPPAEWKAAHTNLTARFVQFSDITNRAARLQRLDLGAGSAVWSSSFFDAAFPSGAPAAASFGWTEYPYLKIYDTTRWHSTAPPGMSRFLPQVSCCGRHVDSYNDYYDLFATEIVYAASYYPSSYSLLSDALNAIDVGGWDDDYTGSRTWEPHVPPFDHVILTAYPDMTNNIVSWTNITARHVAGNLAQSDRALALFDRTLKRVETVVGYTNSVFGEGKAGYKSAASLSPVYISQDGEGGYELDLSHVTPVLSLSGSTSETNGVAESSEREDVRCPRLRISTPQLSASADFTPTNSWYSELSFYDAEFRQFVLSVATNYMETVVTPRGILVERSRCPLECYSEYDGSSFTLYVRLANPDGSRYWQKSVPVGDLSYYGPVEGSAQASASYDYRLASGPRLPDLGDFDRYPQYDEFVTTNGSPCRAFIFSSFADTEALHSWDGNVALGRNESSSGGNSDWQNLIDFGYRADIGACDAGTGYADPLRDVMLELEGKCAVGSYYRTDPAGYTGLRSSDLTTAVANFNSAFPPSATLVVNHTILTPYEGEGYSRFAWSGNGTVVTSVSSWDVGGYHIEIEEDTGATSDKIPIGAVSMSVHVEMPTTGITIRSKPRSVDTHVEVVKEVNWDFPQLRVTDP